MNRGSLRRLLVGALLLGVAVFIRGILRPPAPGAPAEPPEARPPARLAAHVGASSRAAFATACAAAVVLVVVGAAALGAHRSGSAPTRGSAPLEASGVPAPVASQLGIGPLKALPAAVSWAPVVKDTPVIAQARPDAPTIARLTRGTPERTHNIVVVLDTVRAPDGGVWVKVRVPGASSTSVGWVPREALGGYTPVVGHVVVDLKALTLTLTRRGRVIFRAPVGVGTASAPTPTGEFYIRNKLSRYRSPFYGPLAFGTSATSPTLTDWPAGGFVGIHGTDSPELVPGRVSHGCIRLRNHDLLRLARVMAVGTPVTIR